MTIGAYLGEFPVDIENSPFANRTLADWAMAYVEQYGQIDGAHHKTWVLDQVARILKGTPVIVVEARWENYAEYRFRTDEPSAKYLEWVEEMKGEYDEEYECYEYDYDAGIAP